jgi:hypothetical protein
LYAVGFGSARLFWKNRLQSGAWRAYDLSRLSVLLTPEILIVNRRSIKTPVGNSAATMI